MVSCAVFLLRPCVGELLFLLWGVYLCYTVRTVPSAFHEPRYMAVAVYNELLISAVFHIIRWVLTVSQTISMSYGNLGMSVGQICTIKTALYYSSSVSCVCIIFYFR